MTDTQPANRVAEFPASRQSNNTALVPTNMNDAMRLAEMMSQGKLVPEHLQGAPADCLLVIEQSMRWHMSPFAVGQSTSSIKGKLMFEGKLVAAAVNNSGILSGRLNCDYAGQGSDRRIRVFGTIRGESEPRSIEVGLPEVATNNEVWKKQPDQQLFYAGARVWARRHAPEVMLGVYTPEEFDQAPDDAGPTEPKPMGRAELEPYPEDKFEANLPKWQARIVSDELNAEGVIAKLSTKATLSDEQKRRIRECANAETDSAPEETEQEDQ